MTYHLAEDSPTLEVVPFGTTIHATHRPEDLIPAFLKVLEDLIAAGDVEPDDTSHRDIVADAQKLEAVRSICDVYPPSAKNDLPVLVDELITAIGSFCPTYTYFGTHEGDGSDFGFWFNSDSFADAQNFHEAQEVDRGTVLPRDSYGYILYTNPDHTPHSLHWIEDGRIDVQWRAA